MTAQALLCTMVITLVIAYLAMYRCVVTVLVLSLSSVVMALDYRLVPADVPQDIEAGNFRILCEFSHAAYDDPIVKWGQPGDAHHHFFFGNTLTNAFSDTDSLMTTGASTCQGQTLNRSAYWIPAVYDSDGQPALPDSNNIYYKNQANEPASSIQDLPEGLRIIAGNAKGNNPDDAIYAASWRCESWPYDGSRPSTVTMPDCAAADRLLMTVIFPECWNGGELTSSDQSHMSYAIWQGDGEYCPATHPVVLPQITYNFWWNHPDQSTDGWYLSSDRHETMNMPAGSTLHADWWNGWNRQILSTWTRECLQQSRDCDTGNLGNGTAMRREYLAGGGRMAASRAAGPDAILCNGRVATLVGTKGDDIITGTSGPDVVVSYGGDDLINTFGGKDVICAGAGDDTINAGADADEIRAGSGADTITGGDGADRIYAGAGDDDVMAGEGADTVYGHAGNDVLDAGPSEDWLLGGRGEDQLYGSYFSDNLYGGPDNDELFGVGGINVLNGGGGSDNCNAGAQMPARFKNCQ